MQTLIDLGYAHGQIIELFVACAGIAIVVTALVLTKKGV